MNGTLLTYWFFLKGRWPIFPPSLLRGIKRGSKHKHWQMKWSLTLENHCLTTERCVSGGERQRLWPGESAGCRLPENWVTPTTPKRIPSIFDPRKGSLASRIPQKVMREASCHMILFLSHFNKGLSEIPKSLKTFTLITITNIHGVFTLW